MAMSVAEIDAAISDLEEAKRKRLLGLVSSKVGYDGISTERSLPTIDEMNGEIARLQAMRAGLTGAESGLGPIRVGFGCRL